MEKETRVCGFCELVPIDGKFVYEEWIGVPVCLECYLELKGINPNAVVDFCQRCSSDYHVRYYPVIKQSLCRYCAEGIPLTTLS